MHPGDSKATVFAPGTDAARPRLPYQAPRLTDLGDLRDVTLGASPGIGDSGSVGTQRCPGCP